VEFKPSWINVTYHRTETIIRKNAEGVQEKVDVHKRPGTVGNCAAIMNHYNEDPVPHIFCGSFSNTDEACQKVGTEWLIQQSKELMAAGVPILHYYTLGKPQAIRNVCQNVY
jgi:5,10-methylenetetrahydrofolate reductase